MGSPQALKQVGAGLGKPGTYATGKPRSQGELMASAKGVFALKRATSPKLKSSVVKVPPKPVVKAPPLVGGEARLVAWGIA